MPLAELPLDQLPLDTPYAFAQDGMKIVLVRSGGNVFAFEDVCPHAFWPLSAGTFQNGRLECPGHAWEFDVRTGKCHDSPSYCLTPITATVSATDSGKFVQLRWDSSTSPVSVTPQLITATEGHT